MSKNEYASALSRYGDSWQSLKWNSAKQQVREFETAVKALRMENSPGKSVLEIGAGLGHMQEWLRANGYTNPYTGVEREPKLAIFARGKGRNVLCGTLESYASRGDSADYVVCLGVALGYKQPVLDYAVDVCDSEDKQRRGC